MMKAARFLRLWH